MPTAVLRGTDGDFDNDNRLVRTDGSSRNVQISPVTCDDNGNLSGVGSVNLATIIGGVQDLDGDGVVDVVKLTTKWGTTGENAASLADGSEGQLKIVIMDADMGDGTLTPSNFGNGSTMTFAEVGDCVLLQFISGNWWVVANSGVAVA